MENRNNFKKKPVKFFVTAALSIAAPSGKGIKYQDAVDMISRGNYEEFSYPVKLSSTISDPKSEKHYASTIGYIKSYDSKTQTFTIVVNEKNSEILKRVGSTFHIIPTFIINKDDTPRVVTGFNIVPADDVDLEESSSNNNDSKESMPEISVNAVETVQCDPQDDSE